MAVKPSPARRGLQGAMAEVNRALARLAGGEERAWYVDVAAGMLDDAGNPRPELYAADGLHLSPAGYAHWTEILRPAVAAAAAGAAATNQRSRP
jgi:lysophospholipase L1-like esterase